MDFVSKEKRSAIMRGVKGKDTKPEIRVRSLLHGMGYRFRLHRKDLPGRPDICLPKWRTVIFVHGCFWHQHGDCGAARIPDSNRGFWIEKFKRTKERDKAHREQLEASGWKVFIVWECDLADEAGLKARMSKRLEG